MAGPQECHPGVEPAISEAQAILLKACCLCLCPSQMQELMPAPPRRQADHNSRGGDSHGQGSRYMAGQPDPIVATNHSAPSPLRTLQPVGHICCAIVQGQPHLTPCPAMLMPAVPQTKLQHGTGIQEGSNCLPWQTPPLQLLHKGVGTYVLLPLSPAQLSSPCLQVLPLHTHMDNNVNAAEFIGIWGGINTDGRRVRKGLVC